MWSEELMANNNRLFRWGTSCRRRSRAEVVRSCGVQIEEEGQARGGFESLENAEHTAPSEKQKVMHVSCRVPRQRVMQGL